MTSSWSEISMKFSIQEYFLLRLNSYGNVVFTRSAKLVQDFTLSHRSKMFAILQTTFSNPILKGSINNSPALVEMAWLTADWATSRNLNQWWLVYWRLCASLGLNELIMITRKWQALISHWLGAYTGWSLMSRTYGAYTGCSLMSRTYG